MIDRTYLNAIGWRGIRIRIRGSHLGELLRDAAARLRGAGKPVRVLDVAAGHGRYVLQALGSGAQRADAIVLRDFSPLNVNQGTALIQTLGASCVNPVRCSSGYGRWGACSRGWRGVDASCSGGAIP